MNNNDQFSPVEPAKSSSGAAFKRALIVILAVLVLILLIQNIHVVTVKFLFVAGAFISAGLADGPDNGHAHSISRRPPKKVKKSPAVAGLFHFQNTFYSTVTLLARLRGWSISQPRRTAI